MELRGIGSSYNAATRFIDDNVSNGLGDKAAVYYNDQSITYSQLQEFVNRAGNGLKELSVEMENRVLLICHDTPEMIAAFYGAVKIGAVPIPVNTIMAPADYEYFLNNSRAKAVVVHEDIWHKIRHLRDRFIYLRHVIVIHDSAIKEAGVIDYHEWIQAASPQLEVALTDPGDSAFWLYSSGSTGKPKGVIHLQHDMEWAYNTYAKQILQIRGDDITFSASKLFFAYGLGNGMYFPLGAGASTVLLRERPKPETVLETIEKYKPTIFFGVPTLYGSMIDLVERSGKTYDLSSLRLCVSAGEALPAQFIRKWKLLFGVDILDGIGSTEALHIFISNRVGDIREGSTGKIVPGYEAKIVNEMGEALPPNETGDLLIKGDSIASAYWNLHEENKNKFYGEWFQTGDKYYMDEEGYFWYCGRSDDMIKVGGIWVSPIEVENALIRHDAVLEVAVVGAKLDSNLVQPKAYVVLKEGVAPSDSLMNDMKDFLKKELAPYKYPRIIEFIDELPKTASGKIQRFKLRIS
ncbi:benzoate-CoA ligase family protein [Paenibacillus naphthalenovorans]|uniref:benzoate-CoA ligase family protein n=1 Tax=Paenibacillus naphthalenovorans TaxID=162209 RepID=UPI0010B22820|nr:benzoate-CoA ligase family protein [Paenibacillus naphthalenovorans]GCL73538.1 benzoate-CoA ligase family protein [Paenibacillus naphthalenovorans]